MKFLRASSKAQSLRQLSLRQTNDDKQNVDPCRAQKSLKQANDDKENIKPCRAQKPVKKAMIPQPSITLQPIAMQAETQLPSEAQPLSEPIVPQPSPQRQESVYQQEILKFLLGQDRPAPVHYNYFDRQADITQHMRVVLFNWLIDVHLKYKLHPQTFFITINIIDNFLSTQTVHRTQLQLVGITALWIAAKYQETYQVPKISNLVYICDSTYNDAQILEMEARILSEIKFDFMRVTSFSYYEVIKRHTILGEKDQFLGRYLLEGVLFDVGSRKYTELTIAASVIFFIQKLRGYELTIEQKVSEITGVSEKELRACAREICGMWQRFHEVNQLASLRQKYMRPENMQVAKIRLSEKNQKASK